MPYNKTIQLPNGEKIHVKDFETGKKKKSIDGNFYVVKEKVKNPEEKYWSPIEGKETAKKTKTDASTKKPEAKAEGKAEGKAESKKEPKKASKKRPAEEPAEKQPASKKASSKIWLCFATVSMIDSSMEEYTKFNELKGNKKASFNKMIVKFVSESMKYEECPAEINVVLKDSYVIFGTIIRSGEEKIKKDYQEIFKSMCDNGPYNLGNGRFIKLDFEGMGSPKNA